jgi:hypothetical protein
MASSGDEFFAFTFDDSVDPNHLDPDDMRGGKRAARRFVDWHTFFDFRDGNVRNNKKIDSKLSTALMSCPDHVVRPLPGCRTTEFNHFLLEISCVT